MCPPLALPAAQICRRVACGRGHVSTTTATPSRSRASTARPRACTARSRPSASSACSSASPPHRAQRPSQAEQAPPHHRAQRRRHDEAPPPRASPAMSRGSGPPQPVSHGWNPRWRPCSRIRRQRTLPGARPARARGSATGTSDLTKCSSPSKPAHDVHLSAARRQCRMPPFDACTLHV